MQRDMNKRTRGSLSKSKRRRTERMKRKVQSLWTNMQEKGRREGERRRELSRLQPLSRFSSSSTQAPQLGCLILRDLSHNKKKQRVVDDRYSIERDRQQRSECILTGHNGGYGRCSWNQSCTSHKPGTHNSFNIRAGRAIAQPDELFRP